MENKHLTVGLCLVAAILFIFCPSKEKHCEHLANEIHSKAIEQSIVDSSIEIAIGTILEILLGEDFDLIPSGIIDCVKAFLTPTEYIASKLKTQVKYNHYGIFSTTTNSKGETLSFGILGMVIITTEEL